MQSKSTLTLVVSALAFTLLAGCADTAGSKSGSQNPQATSSSPAQANSAGSANAAPAPAAAPQNSMANLAAAADGTVAEFDKTSTELTPEAIATIANTSEAAKTAERVEVTGYCDRHDEGKNAKHVALTRARAVRAELIKNGVPAKSIRVKYLTDEARHAVTVVLK